MTDYNKTFEEHINKIKLEGRYREFLPVQRQADNFPIAWCNGQEVVMWCINDYLGMSGHPDVKSAASEAISKYGIGSGGTRNIGGNNTCLIELEQELASLHEKEQALVLTSGYVANDTSLCTLAKIMPDIVFFSDELNHASIISGIYNSKAEKHIYRHIDVQHLEELLKSVDINRPKIIVFESAYSMDGLFSPIKEIVALAKKYKALTFIDEVHTVGLYGDQGAGVAQLMGQASEIDIIQGTLGKSYGTIGGYIASSRKIIESIRLTASGFIFTTSLPPSISAAATASIRYLRKSNTEREVYRSVISKVKSSFDQHQINYFKNESHIIPIIIGDPSKAKQASFLLLNKHNIYVQHINFPTVPRGTERLRIIPTPNHTDQMIDNLSKALVATFKELDL